MRKNKLIIPAICGLALFSLNCSCSSDDEPKKEDVKYSLVELNEGFSKLDADGNKIQGIADGDVLDGHPSCALAVINEKGSNDKFVFQSDMSVFQLPSCEITLEFNHGNGKLDHPYTPRSIAILDNPIDINEFSDKHCYEQFKAWYNNFNYDLALKADYDKEYDKSQFGKVNYSYNDDENGCKYSITIPENKSGHPRLIELRVNAYVTIIPIGEIPGWNCFRFLQH
ncbi:MAG: hypothetical protein NC194_04905 [Prevotella sp.]|nr:hypothetical protein [Prevotella sp.]